MKKKRVVALLAGMSLVAGTFMACEEEVVSKYGSPESFYGDESEDVDDDYNYNEDYDKYDSNSSKQDSLEYSPSDDSGTAAYGSQEVNNSL